MTRREEPIPAVSAGLSYVMMTGLLLVAANPRLDPARHTPPTSPVQHPSDAVPQRSEPSAPSAPAAQPVPSAPAEIASQAPEEWAQEDITRGREQCMHVLATTAAEIEWLEPIKKGACGLPAPVCRAP